MMDLRHVPRRQPGELAQPSDRSRQSGPVAWSEPTVKPGPIGPGLPFGRSRVAAWSPGGSRVWLAVSAFALTAATAFAAPPTAKQALSLRPMQPNVEYQQVADDEIDACRVEDIDRPGWSGWRVVAPDGTLLRQFADTNGDKRIDLWSYFQFGVEVYRDLDGDFNGKADQYRWLGTGGTRWGIDEDEDGTIDRWQMISPEEVSAELVAALRDRDAQRFAALLATAGELEQAGLRGEKLKSLTEKVAGAAERFADFAEQDGGLGPESRWIQFAGSMPGVVPQGTDGAAQDLVVYENAVAMYQEGQRSGQLLLGTMIRVGDGWRLIELPTIVRGGESVAQATGNFFSPTIVNPATETSAQLAGGASQELVNDLEAVDRQLASASSPKQLAELHARRADLVEKLVQASRDNREDRETWVRQLVDTVSMAIQSGSYPGGLPRLKQVAGRYAADNESLAAYANFQAIGSEYVLRQSQPDADFAEVQEWYLKELTDFVEKYSRTPEAGQAMLQLGLSKEFEEKEKEALAYYRKVAEAFPRSDAGQMAAGAVRRLESVGRPLELEGGTLAGQRFNLASMRGRPVIIHYWASWCEPCKQDMKLLRRLQSQFPGNRLGIVGVNLDITPNQAAEYIRESGISWPQLHAEGGLESSPLAKRFGVQTLPLMMLVDASGKVISHNIRAAELPDAVERAVQGGGSGGRRASR